MLHLIGLLAALNCSASPCARELKIVHADLIYPTEARRKGEEGVVTIQYEVGKNGKITKCSVTRSSGFGDLDQATCSAARSWRFVTDGDSSLYDVPLTRSVGWQLEGTETHNLPTGGSNAIPLPDPMRGVHLVRSGELLDGTRANVAITVMVETDGRVSSCSIRSGTGNRALDDRACTIAMKWTYKPGLRKGAPVRTPQLEVFRWTTPSAPPPTPNEAKSFNQ